MYSLSQTFYLSDSLFPTKPTLQSYFGIQAPLLLFLQVCQTTAGFILHPNVHAAQNSGVQSVVHKRQQAPLGNLAVSLGPTPHLLSQRLRWWTPAICVLKAFQVILIHLKLKGTINIEHNSTALLPAPLISLGGKEHSDMNASLFYSKPLYV